MRHVTHMNEARYTSAINTGWSCPRKQIKKRQIQALRIVKWASWCIEDIEWGSALNEVVYWRYRMRWCIQDIAPENRKWKYGIGNTQETWRCCARVRERNAWDTSLRHICHWYLYVMLWVIWIGHAMSRITTYVTHMNESYHTSEWAGLGFREPSHTYEYVESHVWIPCAQQASSWESASGWNQCGC